MISFTYYAAGEMLFSRKRLVVLSGNRSSFTEGLMSENN